MFVKYPIFNNVLRAAGSLRWHLIPYVIFSSRKLNTYFIYYVSRSTPLSHIRSSPPLRPQFSFHSSPTITPSSLFTPHVPSASPFASHPYDPTPSMIPPSRPASTTYTPSPALTLSLGSPFSLLITLDCGRWVLWRKNIERPNMFWFIFIL